MQALRDARISIFVKTRAPGSNLLRSSLLLVLLVLVVCFQSTAGPFAKNVSFIQPDGTEVTLHGQGNEFYAIFETLDGFTVTFDPETTAYYYAELSSDGNDFVSTGLLVGRADPAQFGIIPHLRLGIDAVKRKVSEKYRDWERMMQISTRWKNLKRTTPDSTTTASAVTPPASTIGTKIGLCLLIDFDDENAFIPREEIFNFCNADFYENYGNNGSVKKYFQDNSNGLLTYSNVVTAYIRIPNSLHRRSYYNDVGQSCFLQGNLLLKDAIDVMKALPNYESQILPAFNSLTVDSSNQVLAVNVFFAGSDSGVWAYGLWPHSGALTNGGPLALSAGGKKVYRYQMTSIGGGLEMGLFCHENGHLLFGYPDLYDYDFDSSGGAGWFCIMNTGWRGPNPTQICAYLKYKSGWATITELRATSSMLATVTAPRGANFNHFYRYQKPGTPTEYFLIENRQQDGRDANIPSSGVAIWHVDELGDHNDQRMAPNSVHANYELTLVQADNRWDLEYDQNPGDADDLYFPGNASPGYSNHFSDATAPSARWWDGTPSGLNLYDFSASGSTMTFEVAPSLVITSQPLHQSVPVGTNASFQASINSTLPVRFQWRFNGTNLLDQTNALLVIRSCQKTNQGSYTLVVNNGVISVTSAPAQLIVGAPFLFSTIANNTFRGLLVADSGKKYQIEASTNLVTWTPYILLTNVSGQVAFNQENISGFKHQFFRARALP